MTGNQRCTGTCEGRCTRGTGSCSGQCTGTCDDLCTTPARGLPCKGKCLGGCSSGIEQPMCRGSVVIPSAGSECRAHCLAMVNAKTSCRPGRVRAEVHGSTSPSATKLTFALQRSLPALLVIALGKKARLEVAVTDVRGAFDDISVLHEERRTRELAGCLSASRALFVEASKSIEASLKQSGMTTASAGSG
jgi:hypothetical protein